MKKVEGKPLVSVIMPCYNHEKYVAQSIESVLNQTYENVEFIVLDNGSTDGSYEVIKGYSEQIDVILHFDENNAIEVGGTLRTHCTGEYIAFMTSDDLWERNKLEKQMKVFEEMPNVKACFTWANAVDEELNLLEQSTNVFYGYHNRSRYEWIERLLQGNCLSFPSAVVEVKAYKDALENLMLFHQLSDKYLWLLMLLKDDIHIIEEPLVSFRWHTNGNNSNMSSPNVANIIRNKNENALLFEELIEMMDDDTFVGVFGKEFKSVEIEKKKKVLCEKFFLFLRLTEMNMIYGQCAINFYYRHGISAKGKINIQQVLAEEYNYTYMDFQEFVAANGVGYMERELSQVQQRLVEYEKIHIRALQEAISTESDKEQRLFLYRQRVGQRLPEDKREILRIVVNNLRDILMIINGASDDELLRQLPNIYKVVYSMRGILQCMREVILQFDCDMSEGIWMKYTEAVSKEEMEVDGFIDGVLPCYVECYGILQQYVL